MGGWMYGVKRRRGWRRESWSKGRVEAAVNTLTLEVKRDRNR